MKEFREQSSRLTQVAHGDTQQVVADTLGSLNNVLSTLLRDVQELKIRLGSIAGQATTLATDEVRAELAPLRLRLENLAAEVTTLAHRVEALEQRKEHGA